MDDDLIFELPLTKNVTFSNSAPNEQSNETCEMVKGEENYFVFVKSKGVQLVDLICDMAVSTSKTENHIIDGNNSCKGNEKLQQNTISEVVSNANCDTMQDNTLASKSHTSVPEPNSFSDLSGNLLLTEKALKVEEVPENFPKSSKSSNPSSKTDSNTLISTNVPEKPKDFDLSSVFEFVKVEKHFTSFFDLSDRDKHLLKENCGVILIDEKSQEVFCTACRCFSPVKNRIGSLKNLTGHFKGLRHKENLHFYGPAAFFKYNVLSINFFNGKPAFCCICSDAISCYSPADVDLLLDHFESQKHVDLVRKMFNKKAPHAKNGCVTLVLKESLTIETIILDKEKDKQEIFGVFAPENILQDSFDVNALQSLSVAHKTQFQNLAKKVNYQTNYLSVSVRQSWKELILACNTCKKTIFASKVEEHINEQKHLKNLAVKFVNKPGDGDVFDISQGDWEFLDFDESSQEYMCTLCDVKLTSSRESWVEHFQNELHQSQANEPQTVETLPSKKEFASESIGGSDIFSEKALKVEKALENFPKSSKSLDSPSKIDSNTLISISTNVPEKPTKFFDLSSAFKFVKVEKYFIFFPGLSGSDKRSLKENCGVILIDEKSQEVFCTACRCYNNPVNTRVESLRNLTAHFKGLRHKENLRFYGPAAFFEHNVSLMNFYNGKSGSCSICSVAISCRTSVDVDLLLDHFESKKHVGLVRKMFSKKGAHVKNECVTIH